MADHHSCSNHAAGTSEACNRRKLLGQNRISNFPDEILVSILSLLTMKEAGRTSVLSKRWRHVWAYVPTLNFDSGKLSNELVYPDDKARNEEGRKYLYWVDQVVSSHKAPALDEFRVQFDYDNIYGKTRQSIDSWFRFALENKVKRLAIYLTSTYIPVSCSTSFLTCNSLTSLELQCVDISGDAIENLLSSCLALENLYVSYSDAIVSQLRICGPSLTLKCLRIHKCYRVQQLEISAPNLVSLSYHGQKIHVRLQNMRKLAKLSFRGDYSCNFVNAFSNIGCYQSQIEELDLHIIYAPQIFREPMKYPIFERLKKLDVQVKPYENCRLVFLISLINACPFLQHFKLQFEQSDSWKQGQKLKGEHEVYPHCNLKTVEIVGFTGCPADLKFAKYLIDSAPSLEKFIVDTRIKPYFPPAPGGFRVTREIRRARRRARRLRHFLKAGADLIIISF